MPPGDLAGRAERSSPPSEALGEPTCTVLGTEASSSSLLPSVSQDAGVELLGSESGMISGDLVGEGEGEGLSIHMHDE